jgi:peptide/nickel transport system substrate-binding protein
MITYKIKVLLVMMSASLIMVPPAESSSATQALTVQSAQNNNEHPSYGGTLVWGTANPPAGINPILTQSSVSSSLMGLIFDSLVHIDGHGRLVPGLAERWETSKDGLEYTFHLRKGVRFHDGRTFSADDVKFTYDAINDVRNNSPWRTNTSVVRKWVVIDPFTIKAILREPSVPFLRKLVREIVPRHLLEGKNLAHANFNYHPVGTGPFLFKQWTRDNRIELEANPDYFQGRPYLDRIVIKTYPNMEQLWSAFMRQEVDLLKYLSHKDYLVLKGDPTFRTYEISSGTYYALAYNLNDPLISNKSVRQALAYALDRKSIIRMTTGEGEESVGPFHPQSFGFNDHITPFEYDPRKALELLEREGWKMSANGVLQKDGSKFTLTLLADPRQDDDRKIAMTVRQQLSEIGITVVVKFYRGEQDLHSNLFERFKAQIWLRSLTGIDVGDSYNVVVSWYSSSSEFARFGGYHNKSVDNLLETARSTADDEKRADLYKEIHSIIYNDQPAGFLFYPMTYHAISSRIRGTDDYFSVFMPAYTMKEWYVNQVNN